MDELVKVVVDDSQSTDALNRIAAAGARADTSINNLGQTIDRTTQATRSASGAAASNAASVQNQASAFQRLQSIVIGAASSFQRLASTTSGTLGSAFSRLQTVAGNAFSAIISYANNAGGALNNFNRNLQQNQRSMDNLWRLASATAAANIFGAMWDKATAGISAYIDRMTEVQRTMSMLTVVTPTGQQGEFDYIMKTADRYGVRLQSLANNYAKLAISAREANVPQETMRKLFEGTSIGARVMHMSVSQVDLTFQALTQMMSKGVVSTEELRRQFAERMPGAIHATAKELGVTYDELDKFVRNGKALSDKFVPYLANALINSFGKGIGPAASALDAELNRIHNSFDKFFKQVYDAGGDKGPAAAIRALNEKLNNPEIAKSFARWVDSISKEVTKFIQSITMEDIEKGANTFISVLKAIGDMAVFAAKSVKWLSENLGIVGGLLGAYMGAKIGFMVAGPPGMAVGAAIGGLGGAVGGMAMSGAGTPGTQLQPSKTNSQMFLENQLRLQANGSTNGAQFNKTDLDLLSGLPQMKIDALPELLPLKKVGPGTTLDDLLGGATGGRKNGAGAKAAAAAAARALEKQEDLMAKLHGLNKNFAEEWDTLNTVFNSAANKKQQFLPLEDLISLQQELLEQQPFMKKIREDEATSLKYQMKELDEYNKVQQNLLDDKKKMAEESLMDAQRMEDEAVAWQYAKDNAVDLATGIQMMAQARAQDNYETALAAGSSGELLLALQKELEARNRILNQTKANDIRDTAEEEYKKLAKRQANFWDDTFQNADRAGRSIFQSLARGGDDAFKQVGETIQTSIVDVLYQMTAQKWMISIGTSIFGDGFAAAAARAVGGGGAGNGLLGTTLQGAQMYQGLTSGTGLLGNIGSALGLGAASAYSLGGAAALGASSGVAAGGGLGLSLTGGGLGISAPAAGYFGGVSSGVAGGAAASSGTLSGALSAIPGWGWAIGAVAALAAIFGKKSTPHMGAASSYSEAGGLVSNADIYQSVGFRDARTYNAEAASVTGGVAKAISDALNSTARAFGKTAGYEITTAFADDKSKDGAWGSLIIKQMGDAVIDWRDTQTSKWAPKEFADGEAGSKEYLAEVAKSARDALVQAIGDVGWATDMLKGLGDTVSLESLAQTVQQIGAAKAAFVSFGQYMPVFAAQSDAAMSAMVKASGSVDALAGNMSMFVDGFYTDAEKLAINTENVRAAMERLGFEMPTTRDEFKALVQAQIALGDAGAATAAGLLGLSGAFASVTAASETAAEAAARLADEHGKAAEAAARAAEKAAEEAARRAEEIARERYGLETQIMQLLGDTAGLRMREIEALDASNRALQEHIYAIEDASEAYQKSITAANDAYSGLERSVTAEKTALQAQYELKKKGFSDTLKVQADANSAQIEAARAAADKIMGIASALQNALESSRVDSPSINAARLSSARSTISGAAESNNLFTPGLESALAVAGADNKQFYGRFEDYAYAQGVTAGEIAKLSANAQAQLSAAESIVSSLAAQNSVAQLISDAEMAALDEWYAQELKKLDDTLTLGKSQLDAMLGIDNSVLSVADAVANLTNAINASNAALQAQKAAEAAAQMAAMQGGGGGGGGGGAGGPEVWGGQTYTDFMGNLVRVQDGQSKQFYEAVAAAGTAAVSSLSELRDRLQAVGKSDIWDALSKDLTLSYQDVDKTGGRGVPGISASDGVILVAGYRSDNESMQDYATKISGWARNNGVQGPTNNGYSQSDISNAISTTLGQGVSVADILNAGAANFGLTEQEIRDAARAARIPGFATGINRVPHDMLARIHKDEAVVPAAYNPYNPGASAPGNSEVVAELRKLNERMARIEASSKATAGHTAGTDRKLARAIQNDAIKTETTV